MPKPSFRWYRLFSTRRPLPQAGTKRAAIIDSVLDYDHASGRTVTVAADRIVAYVTDNGLGVDCCSKRMSVPIICPLAPGRADRDWTLNQQRVFGTLFQIYADLARDESAFDRLFEDGDRFGDLNPPCAGSYRA